MSQETKESCALCGLEIGTRPYELETADGSLRFCCDGCVGIYRLLNDIDDEDPLDTKPGAESAG